TRESERREHRLSSSVCFFFQAEDGIRDRNVTGVQTCALPIFIEYQVEGHFRPVRLREEFKWCEADQPDRKHCDDKHCKKCKQRTLYDFGKDLIRIEVTAPCEGSAD